MTDWDERIIGVLDGGDVLTVGEICSKLGLEGQSLKAYRGQVARKLRILEKFRVVEHIEGTLPKRWRCIE